VTITKRQQVAFRREKVLEMAATGLSQQDISAKLMISQKTVSNDVAWLRKDAIEFIRSNKEQLAYEYRQTLSNFYQLRKEAWNHFQTTQSESIKAELYSIIESININILDLVTSCDMIEAESMLKDSKNEAAIIKEGLNQTVDSTQLSNQAQF